MYKIKKFNSKRIAIEEKSDARLTFPRKNKETIFVQSTQITFGGY